MLPERGDGTEREVDVLLTFSQSGLPVRIAIECRNWRIKHDVAWIDLLIGKYRDLGIDKVVAVSSTGFTPAAIAKAKDVGIVTLTLRFSFKGPKTKSRSRVRTKKLGISR